MDPTHVLDRLVLEMRAQLHIAQKQVCVAIADERVLRQHVDRHAAASAHWEQRAMQAVRAGDDVLARAALARKAEQDELTATYDAQWRDQRRAVDNLRAALRGLDQRIADAARQRNVLLARWRRAEAQRTISATLGALASHSPWTPLERLEERVTQIEAEAEAAAEAAADLRGEDASLEAQFAALERSSVVDDELAALKLRMSLRGEVPRRALPPS
jgi:phage shock protein A